MSVYSKILFSLILAGMIIIVLLSGYLYYSYRIDPIPLHRSQGKNALWAKHQWVEESHSPDEYKQLATHLKQHEITDIFVHVGPLNAAGHIEPQKYPFAKELLQHLKQEYPSLHIQAWIGQIEAIWGGPLDLSNPTTHTNIIQTAETFLDLGFDGIHYNIEPIYSGDERFLTLLQKTKEVTKGRQKILSIASDETELFRGLGYLTRLLARRAGFWEIEYYQQIAAKVDQIAVMMYDTALPTDWLYGNLVKWETKRLIPLSNPKLTVFIGIPTYEESSWGFHPKAENIRSGIRGIQKGLATFEKTALQNVGLAIYAEWTTDQAEWDTYREMWLPQGSKQ